jgi:methylphosphotriester-DNA--protein-cysteine methyltransferase
MLTYVPRWPLSDFVEIFWLFEDYARPHPKERCLPTGTVELVIELQSGPLGVFSPNGTNQLEDFRGAVVCGAHSEPFVIDTSKKTTILGVHFKPGGAFPFLNLPAGELHNTHISLQALWGPRAGELGERLCEAKTHLERFRLLERFLFEQAKRRLERHPAVAFALSQFEHLPQATTIAALTERIGLSARHFIERFTAEVGLTPKLFCRVRRFQDVVRQIHPLEAVDWCCLALDSGYYDQAHFIHEFRSFSGLTPTEYLRNRTEHLNHVPIFE